MAKKKTDIVDNENTAEELEEVSTTRRRIKQKPQLDLRMEVPVRSVVDGMVGYVSNKTGFTYMWNEQGEEQWIEIGELINMKASKPSFLNKPWLLIDDEEVNEYLGLTKIFNSIADVTNLKELYEEEPDEITSRLQAIPKGYRETVINVTQDLIDSEELHNPKVIRAIEKGINFKF